MYFVTKYVVPEKHVPIASWVIGWSNFLGQLVLFLFFTNLERRF
jgi:hypothetical protein